MKRFLCTIGATLLALCLISGDLWATNSYYNHTNAFTAGSTIRSSDMNAKFDGIEDGFDKMPAPHGSAPSTKGFSEVFKIVDATAIDHPIALGQVQGNTFLYNTATGTDTYALDLTPNVAAYAAGQVFWIKPQNDNTGAATLNVDGLGAKAIKLVSGLPLPAGVLDADGIYAVIYDGTDFALMGSGSIHTGVDDNATQIVMEIDSDDQTIIFGGVSGNPTSLEQIANNKYIQIKGGADSNAATLVLTGSSYGSASEVQFQSIASQPVYQWSSSSGTHTFRTGTGATAYTNLTLSGTTGAQEAQLAGVLFLDEEAAAYNDKAGYGQIWVKSGAPNTLWFTDENGSDHQLGVGAPGIDDNTTGVRLTLNDASMLLGTTATLYAVSGYDTASALVLAGGPSYDGASLGLYGSTYPSTGGDINLRSGSDTIFYWDDSLGEALFYTGSGTLALTLTSDQTIKIPPGNAAVSTDGEIEIYSDGWGSNHDALQYYDGTNINVLIGVPTGGSPSAGYVPTYQAGGTFVLAAQTGGGGATTYTILDNSDIAGTPQAISTAQAVIGTKITNDGAGTAVEWDLPTCVAGRTVDINEEDAYTITLDPDDADAIVDMDGTAATAGYRFRSTGTGACKIQMTCRDATYWWIDSMSCVWSNVGS